jgi:hypothetical protein
MSAWNTYIEYSGGIPIRPLIKHIDVSIDGYACDFVFSHPSISTLLIRDFRTHSPG